MVGGGIFKPQVTARSMTSVIPSKVKWMKAAVAGFDLSIIRLFWKDANLFNIKRWSSVRV